MSLIVDQHLVSFGGGTLARARDRDFSVVRSGKLLGQFNIECSIEWLKVSQDGKMALIYGARGTRVWRWREVFGVDRFLEAANNRDLIGCGFIFSSGAVVTMASQGGKLRGISEEGVDLFSNNLSSPHSFRPRHFIRLPGRRVALTGSFFSDYCDVVVTLGLDDLFHDSEAIQKAIRAKAPVWDRAIDLTIGPCDPVSAVVLRDPEDTEIPESDEDLEDLGDVGNFTGVYIRDLDTGRLVERHPYTGRAGTGAPIVASKDLIAVQVMGGIDTIHRTTGVVHNVPEAVLDVSGLQVAKVENGNLKQSISLDTLDPSNLHEFNP